MEHNAGDNYKEEFADDLAHVTEGASELGGVVFERSGWFYKEQADDEDTGADDCGQSGHARIFAAVLCGDYAVSARRVDGGSQNGHPCAGAAPNTIGQ